MREASDWAAPRPAPSVDAQQADRRGQAASGSAQVQDDGGGKVVAQAKVVQRHAQPMGGIFFFWDLGRLFGNTGPQCVSGSCQPSWGGSDTLANLASLASAMRALKTK